MRIVHFEDEWPRARMIAHWLHDKIYQQLPPQEAVEIDLKEEETPKEEVLARIVVERRAKPDKVFFEYLIVTNLETLKKFVTPETIVIVDIMRSDEEGRFVSNLDAISAVFPREGVVKDNWRYFSAYPEKVPEEAELKGFSKNQEKALVDYLYGKLREKAEVP